MSLGGLWLQVNSPEWPKQQGKCIISHTKKFRSRGLLMSQQRCQRPSFFLFAVFFLHYSASSSGSFPHGHRMAAAAPGILPRHNVQKQEKGTFSLI